MDDGLSDLSRLMGCLGLANNRLVHNILAERMRSILVSLSSNVTPAG